MKEPNPNSNRSKRRANRNFNSLETSCRKHRRNLRRMFPTNDKFTTDKGYKPRTGQNFH